MVKALMLAVAGFLAATVSAMAQPCPTLPFTLTNGTNANANNVMDDLNHLRNCINNITVAPVTPTGRLTLTSATPVMTAEQPGTSTIYYTPYIGARVPIYDGSQFVPFVFAQLSATTTTGNQLANQVYDLFVFLNPSTQVVTLGFGPAWATPTSRGTAQLEQVQGLWVNQNVINLTNGMTPYAGILARKATYVGTVAITASAGQMAMQFKPPTPVPGGTNTWLGVWNAYNRVSVLARSTEIQSFWDYGTQAYRAVNGSNNNRINWVDGLQQSRVIAQFNQVVGMTNSGALGAVGWDSTTTASGTQSNSQNLNPSAGSVVTAASRDFNVLLGRHYVQALESAQSGTPRFYGGQTVLEVELDM